MNNTTTIKGFCDFVNYLYDNKNAFAKYNNIVAKMQNIINESSQLQPKKYADDRKQNEALQEQYKEYYSIIEENVILPIKEKGRELAGLLFEYEDKNRLQEAFNEIADLTKQNIESISICIDKFFDFTSDVKIVGFDFSFIDFEYMIKELYAEIKNNPYGIKPKHKPIFEKNTITSPPSPPAKLIKSLTINKQNYLYSKLTEKSLFLPVGTDFDSFCFVFGNSPKPENFKPLKWLKNRQLLREIIITLKHPDITIPTSKYKLPPYFLDEKGNPIAELPTNTPKDLKIEHYIDDLAKM